MLELLRHRLSAERIDIENSFLPPFFYQQQKAYSFCLKFVRNKNILEVGSGSGYGTYRLAKVARNILGIDSDEIAVRKSREKYKVDNLRFNCSRLEDYSNKQKFDVIVALQVLEHIEKPELFLETAVSLLKRDGLFLVTTPNSQTQSYNENPYHYKEYTFTELKDILSKYFNEVTLLGLSGDSKVKKFEKMRKKYILNILKLDRFRLRRFIPRSVMQVAFDITTFLNRVMYQQNRKFKNEIIENNYKVVKENKSSSIDIIAVCRY